MTTIVANVDHTVRTALAMGERFIIESDTYRQHCLREHPNVCRQAERGTDRYPIHTEPCGCPPLPQAPSAVRVVATGTCCWTAQPIHSECAYCGEPVPE
jgi:hypothetical protein